MVGAKQTGHLAPTLASPWLLGLCAFQFEFTGVVQT
jgi:hypothetical protein